VADVAVRINPDDNNCFLWRGTVSDSPANAELDPLLNDLTNEERAVTARRARFNVRAEQPCDAGRGAARGFISNIFEGLPHGR